MATQPLHRARFARHQEVWPLLSSSLAPDGILLGTRRVLLSQPFVTVRPTKQRSELGNLLIVAPTRSGKGLLAVSQLLAWHHSVIVNDIKGDLFTQTAGFRSLLGPVYVLDPTGVGHRYDPLVGKETEDALYSSAAHLLHQAGEQDIFTQRATKMLACLFAAAKRQAAAALPYTRMMLRAGLVGCVERLHAVSPELATVFLDVSLEKAHLEDRFLLSAWGTLTTKLHPLLTETVIRSLAYTDFTSEEIMISSRPVTVYMRWRTESRRRVSRKDGHAYGDRHEVDAEALHRLGTALPLHIPYPQSHGISGRESHREGHRDLHGRCRPRDGSLAETLGTGPFW